MTKAACSDEEFIDLFRKVGAQALADHLKLNVRNVYSRRANLEKKLSIQIKGPNDTTRTGIEHPARQPLTIKNGTVLIGSDAHYWPGEISTAHRAFVRFASELNPRAVIMNGDVLDGATVSRHPSIGWEDKPALIEELESCQDRLNEIQQAAPKAQRIWTLGNHDGRFETRLANVAPEYAKIHGVHLKDHFPYWEPCWSVWINNEVVIKHRFKGGVHATHNNALSSGKSMVTGHLHSLKVTPWTDYTGTRWGVDCGTLAEPDGPQFVDYTEDNPKNWISGFAVLTFKDGELLWPEVVHVTKENMATFRGEVIHV